ncbi:MAG TPA: hypothetical protein PL010_12230 [Flavobacteriales bacterium]|nr:hypothetical protein [Flavobacteriales bacterium]HMW96871.1 hypothetical protein [Flavobacteriales bacterium]HNE81751.1 hypothetical protein [Flavobacteriales bacterium]HNI05382.1 hypothetical protein [Flavobacteriales bacterium]HNK39854.1 hypothetical protein [Flavobacteriales bacterium]
MSAPWKVTIGLLLVVAIAAAVYWLWTKADKTASKLYPDSGGAPSPGNSEYIAKERMETDPGPKAISWTKDMKRTSL